MTMRIVAYHPQDASASLDITTFLSHVHTARALFYSVEGCVEIFKGSKSFPIQTGDSFLLEVTTWSDSLEAFLKEKECICDLLPEAKARLDEIRAARELEFASEEDGRGDLYASWELDRMFGADD